MSNAITTMKINVPDNTDGTHIATEYGCRFPDGHHEWGEYRTNGGYDATYEKAANPNHPEHEHGKLRWTETLTARAESVSLPAAEYIKAHKLVKRLVILTTTAPEEV